MSLIISTSKQTVTNAAGNSKTASLVNFNSSAYTQGLVFEAETKAYSAAITANGGSISKANLTFINNYLVVPLKAQGLWSLIEEFYIFVGQTGLAGAMTKLKYASNNYLTNNAFVSGSLSSLGLGADGTTQYLNPNYSMTPNRSGGGHLMAAVQSMATTAAFAVAIGGRSGGNYSLEQAGAGPSGTGFSTEVNSDRNAGTTPKTNGVWMGTHTTNNVRTFRNSATVQTYTETPYGSAIPLLMYTLYPAGGYGGATYSNALISVASIGYGMTDAQVAAYTTIINTFLTKLGVGLF